MKSFFPFFYAPSDYDLLAASLASFYGGLFYSTGAFPTLLPTGSIFFPPFHFSYGERIELIFLAFDRGLSLKEKIPVPGPPSSINPSELTSFFLVVIFRF